MIDMQNMRRFLIFGCSLLSILFWSMLAGAEVKRKALLIGINDYARSAIPDLRGAVNDAHLLMQVLYTRMNFPKANIIAQLTDQQATRDNILRSSSVLCFSLTNLLSSLVKRV